MAIAFRSYAETNQPNSTSLVANMPAGVVNGDFLVMRIICSSNVNVTNPAGWTVLYKTGTGNAGSYATGQNIYYRIASSEPTTYTITTDQTNSYDVGIMAYTGVSSVSSIDASSANSMAVGTATSPITALGITTVQANDMVLYFAAQCGGGTSGITEPPTGFTTRIPASTTINLSTVAEKVFASPGATGNVTTAYSGTASTWVAHLVALSPVVAADTTQMGIREAPFPPRGRSSKPARFRYDGITEPIQPDPIPLPAPCAIYLDVPTISRLHSLVVYEGWHFDSVRDDNAPSFVMPQPWWNLPDIRYRRGHMYQGLRSDAVKFEYMMGGQFTDVPVRDPAMNLRHWVGQATPQFFIDAPIEVFSKRHFDLPPFGKFTLWQRHAGGILTVLGPLLPSPGSPDVPPGTPIQFLPLLFVGNGTGGFIPVSPYAFRFMQSWDVPMPRWKRGYDYTGESAQPMPADVFPPPNPTNFFDIPVRLRRGINEGQYRSPLSSNILDQIAPYFDLPVRGRVPVVLSLQAPAVGADSLQAAQSAFFDLPIRARIEMLFDVQRAPLSDPAAAAGGMAATLISTDLPMRRRSRLRRVTSSGGGSNISSIAVASFTYDVPIRRKYYASSFQASISVPLLLDRGLGTAVGAYSIRKLRAAYAGSAIKVRRSSDSTTQDIGFTASGDLDESALTTFVGANNGFIDTWYDQSGSANHLVQATTAAQLRIVSSGTIDRFGGTTTIASLVAIAASSTYVGLTYTQNQPFARSTVWKIDALGATSTDIATDNGGSSPVLFVSSAGVLGMYAGTQINGNTGLAAGTKATATENYNNASSSITCNGTKTTGTAGAGNAAGQRFGGGSDGFFAGRCSEYIVWNNTQSDANITAIATDQKNYFGF